MRVRFLGTAAGGGLPQWNCACAGCQAARDGGRSLRQDTVAISGDGRAWYLLNAAPDLRLDAPELRPGPGLRETPLRGVILTSAELDHTTGLLTLREAFSLSVYASSTVLAATPALPLLGRYATLTASALIPRVPTALDGGLTVTAFPLGKKRPRYVAMPAHDPAEPAGGPGAGGSDAAESAGGFDAGGGDAAGDWVIGLRLSDGRTTVVYAPCVPEWSNDLSRADLVILDGTFFTDDELLRHTGVDRTARQMGHLPIEESLPLLTPGPRYLYTHLNNTNPIVRPDSPERALLRRYGAGVAPEGRLLREADRWRPA